MFAAATILAITLAGRQTPQEHPRAFQTDQTVPVPKGAKLKINNAAGEVVLHTWDKDSLRVQAHHSSRMKVNVHTSETGVSIGSSSTTGPTSSVDYDITAPAWMAMRIEGHYNFV